MTARDAVASALAPELRLVEGDEAHDDVNVAKLEEEAESVPEIVGEVLKVLEEDAETVGTAVSVDVVSVVMEGVAENEREDELVGTVLTVPEIDGDEVRDELKVTVAFFDGETLVVAIGVGERLSVRERDVDTVPVANCDGETLAVRGMDNDGVTVAKCDGETLAVRGMDKDGVTVANNDDETLADGEIDDVIFGCPEPPSQRGAVAQRVQDAVMPLHENDAVMIEA